MIDHYTLITIRPMTCGSTNVYYGIYTLYTSLAQQGPLNGVYEMFVCIILIIIFVKSVISID